MSANSMTIMLPPPNAVEMLLEMEQFSHTIYEPCCGAGHIADVLKEHGHEVVAQDLYDHGYGETGINFLANAQHMHGDVVTNPPYKYAQQFIQHSLDLIDDGRKVAMFLKLTFLEGKGRQALFDHHPPQTIYVSRSRINCGMNGEFVGTSAVAFAWFVWQKGYKGNPIIKWFN